MKKIAFLILLLALPLRADLLPQIQAANGWVGYVVPIEAGNRLVCSYNESTTINHGDWEDRVSSALFVLYEVREREILTIRLSSPECRPKQQHVQWIDNVNDRDSVRLLQTLIDRNQPVSKKAISALALHRDTTDPLIAVARRHPSSKVRGQALFWLSQRAGEKAVSTLRNAVDNDPDADVKEKAVFGISQLPNDRSVPLLIELMKSHRSPGVRKKAAFWLGQKDDPRALAAIEEILMR